MSPKLLEISINLLGKIFLRSILRKLRRAFCEKFWHILQVFSIFDPLKKIYGKFDRKFPLTILKRLISFESNSFEIVKISSSENEDFHVLT